MTYSNYERVSRHEVGCGIILSVEWVLMADDDNTPSRTVMKIGVVENIVNENVKKSVEILSISQPNTDATTSELRLYAEIYLAASRFIDGLRKNLEEQRNELPENVISVSSISIYP